jgi:hypothetical protein
MEAHATRLNNPKFALHGTSFRKRKKVAQPITQQRE